MRSSAMIERGFSLLELLIALVLLVAMGALIFPSLIDGLQERTFESAADVTNEQLMMARAHAQSSGAAVEVTYRADTSQVQARWFAPWQVHDTGAGAAPGESQDTSGREPLGPVASSVNQQTSSSGALIPEAWACRDLGNDVRFTASPPASTPNVTDHITADDAADDDDVETLDDLLTGQEVRLAVFMPDGSALQSDAVWLNDDNGRCGKLTVNPWSGLPVFERLTDSSQTSYKITEDFTSDDWKKSDSNPTAADRDFNSDEKSADAPR